MGLRRVLILIILGSGLWAFLHLELTPANLIPNSGGLQVAWNFFSRAFSPALTYEAAFVPAETTPLVWKAVQAAGMTVIFAAAAMSLALVSGLILGFLASTAWWAGDPAGGRSTTQVVLRRSVAPFIYGSTRVLITLMRSIHELLWAVLLLAAFGLSHLSAAVAIAIPFGGTLAKIFAEMIDEAPRDVANAYRGSGASPAQVYLLGLVTRAMPDMITYAFYRFECALRSSAILGFFGYPTLGFFIAASFENLHYGEVWTYLYTLFFLVTVVDWWSGALRKRFAA
jgi:phosphonate transport system permease protein